MAIQAYKTSSDLPQIGSSLVLNLKKDQGTNSVAQGQFSKMLPYDIAGSCIFPSLNFKDLVQLSHTDRGMRQEVLNYLDTKWLKIEKLAEDIFFPLKEMLTEISDPRINSIEKFQKLYGACKNKDISLPDKPEKIFGAFVKLNNKFTTSIDHATRSLWHQLYDRSPQAFPRGSKDWGVAQIREWMGSHEGLFSHLEEIKLANTSFAVPPEIKYFTGLKKLDLGSCKIEFLQEGVFDTLSNLEELNLGQNSLKFLSKKIFEKLTHLKELDLSQNRLDFLPEDVFDQLSNIEKLYLGSNRLTFLPPHIFDRLTHLKELDLSQNRLDFLPEDVFDQLTNIKKLYLSFNPLPYELDQSFVSLSQFLCLQRLYKIRKAIIDWFLSLIAFFSCHR